MIRLTLVILLISGVISANTVNVDFGVLVLPDTCTGKYEWGGYDAWSGNVHCGEGKLSFYFEGGPIPPLIAASDRRRFKSFATKKLPDGNVFSSGKIDTEKITKLYASVCPAKSEFCCATFVLDSNNAEMQRQFLDITSKFKLDPECGFKKKQ